MGEEAEKVADLMFAEDGTLKMIVLPKAIVLTRADVRLLINKLEREEDGHVYSRAG